MSADTRKLVTNENLSAFAERLAEKVPLKSDLPTKVSDLANDRGFTDNAGTITSVTINGVTTSSGGVNLGYLVGAEAGKGLSSNDYTTAEKNKLAGIASGAQVNTIETVKINGTALTPDGNKAIDVSVPTTVAELSDASNYALASDLEDYAQVSDLEDTEEVLTAAVTDLNSRLEDAEEALEDVTDRVESLQHTVQTFPTDISEFNNDSGYITTETDPVFSASPAAQISTTDMAYWDGKQDPLTFDSVPTQNSTNPVTSGGLYTVITQNEYTAAAALNELNDRVSDLEEVQVPEVDEYPTENSNNAVSSGGVYEIITENELAIAASLSNLDSRIPENISDLNDDVGLATTSSLSDYVLKSDYEDDEEVLATAVNDLNTRVTDLEDAPAFTETDPVFSASAAAGITSSDITNWNSKTSNTGTLTGVSFNGTSATVTNGVAAISATLPINNVEIIDVGFVNINTVNASMPSGTWASVDQAIQDDKLAIIRMHQEEYVYDYICQQAYIEGNSNDNFYFANLNENTSFYLEHDDSINLSSYSLFVPGYSDAANITASDIANWNGKTSVTESTVSGWGFTKNTGTVVGSGLTANKLVLGNGTTNIKASTYGVSTSAPASGSDNTTIPTSAAVFSAIDTALTSVLTYRGTIGSSGATVSALPASHAVGDVYVVSVAGTYAGKACEVGDYIICNTDGSSASDAHWNVVTGENQVDNKSASLAAAGSSATIATVDGTNLTITTPSSWTGVDKTGTLTGVSFNGSSATVTNGVASITATIPAAVTESTVSGWGFTKNTGTYSKPSGGIPASDLTTAVQTSLGKADTALQSFTETDPVFSASAAAGITSSDITNWNSKTSNIGNAKIFYGTCSTAGATAAKIVDCSIFTSADLVNGALIFVTFSETNTATPVTLTMNVNSTGAKSIRKQYTAASVTYLTGGQEIQGNVTYLFTYNGSSWVCMTLDYNTTYPTVTAESATAGTSTIAGLVSPSVLKTAITTHAPAAITESDVAGWGFTKNAGTLTGVKVNGSNATVTSGVADIGTVITSETQLSKGTTTGAGNAVTDISVSNHQITLTKGATFLTEHQSIKTINNQTITGTGNVNISGLPAVTSSDNGKILQVVNGAWALVSPISIYSGSESPSNSIGNDGDIYIQS